MDEEKITKEVIISHLENLINFIENMEAIDKNPYSAGLKTSELLSDIKNYTRETIEMIGRIELTTDPDTGEELK